MKRVRKTTFDADLKQKEEAWLALSGEERMRINRINNERLRKPGVNYELRNQKVRVIKKGEHS
jgi:hypothetical protein